MAFGFKITVDGNYPLKSPSEWAVGRWIVNVTKVSGAGTFTIKPQKRVRVEGSAAGSPTPASYADCWYNLALTGADVAAGTTQTADCIMDVDGSGCDVHLVVDVTGTVLLNVYAVPLVG